MHAEDSPGNPRVTIRVPAFDPSDCGLLDDGSGLCIQSPTGFASTETEIFGPTHSHFNQPSSTSSSTVVTTSSTPTSSSTHSTSNSTLPQSTTTPPKGSTTPTVLAISTSSNASSKASVVVSEGGLGSSISSTTAGTGSVGTTSTTKAATSSTIKDPVASTPGGSEPKSASFMHHKGTVAGVVAAIILGAILFVILVVLLWRAYRRSCQRKARRVVPYNVEEAQESSLPRVASIQSGSTASLNNDTKASGLELDGLGQMASVDNNETESTRALPPQSVFGNPPPYTPSEAGDQENVGREK